MAELPRRGSRMHLCPASSARRPVTPRTTCAGRGTAHGFTLVELLVVVAVISLLLGLLVPALAEARGISRSTVCTSNLRQWGIAVNMYAHDNEDFLPRRGQGVRPTVIINRTADWFNALPPVIGLTSFSDLSDQNREPKPGDRSIWVCPQLQQASGLYCFAYGMNMCLSTWDAKLPARIDQVAPTDVQVFMADGPGPQCSLFPSTAAYSPVARHANSTNIAFLDSHVRLFSGRSIGCGIGDPQRSDVMWTVPGSPWNGPGQ